MKTLGYIGAFLGGAIAGAAIGLLAAPESGKTHVRKSHQQSRISVTSTTLSFPRRKWLNSQRTSLISMQSNNVQ